MYCNMDGADTNFLSFAEIATTPRWRRFYRFRDQGLRNLVQHIPSVIAASKSQNTIKSYVHAFRRFERWTAKYPETSAYPATPESVALYLLSLSQSGNSAAVMANAHAAIAWMHQTAGYTDPTSDPVYRTIYDGVRREQATTVVHKKPLDADMIERMRACVTQPGGRIDLDDFQIYTFVLISLLAFSVSRRPARFAAIIYSSAGLMSTCSCPRARPTSTGKANMSSSLRPARVCAQWSVWRPTVLRQASATKTSATYSKMYSMIHILVAIPYAQPMPR